MAKQASLVSFLFVRLVRPIKPLFTVHIPQMIIAAPSRRPPAAFKRCPHNLESRFLRPVIFFLPHNFFKRFFKIHKNTSFDI
ncbi:hypothetical protein LI291_11205 [Intestinibacillus massiliensis]|nr:hypothetical protein [Intestinibacillus massiliensis]